ncbi:MAG: RNA 2',3'-cyclic phosphodiesterase [Candidatus Aenigmarchaeota archaeon]|nr:RNA 2',3'-cyclic phosphodiesterase [Candidatus Aenigmarchaeota archaeon]
MRCFISAELPENIKKQIEDMQKCFGVNKNIKFTSKNNIHITLKFLGNIDSNTVKDIEYALEKRLADIKAPRISIEGLDTFPDQKYIRGVWLKLTSRELKNIKEDIDNIDEMKRCMQDTYKTYRIHATLFRIGKIDSKTRENIIREIEDMNLKMKKISFSIDRIDLKISELKEGGPVYTTLKSYHMKNDN